jgi:hypothetical protein
MGVMHTSEKKREKRTSSYRKIGRFLPDSSFSWCNCKYALRKNRW